MKIKNKKHKRPTQYNTKRRQHAKDSKASLLSSLLLLSLVGAIYTTITTTTPPRPTQASQPLPAPTLSIELKTNNHQLEVIIREASQQACHKHAIDSTQSILSDCINDLVAMAFVETQEDPFNCSLPGHDSYSSLGCFQISRYYHPHITDEQAQDPYFSADWTLARMINHNYKADRNNAIRSHNGSINNPKTLNYLNKVNAFISL